MVTNWAGNQSEAPAVSERPRTVEQLAVLVERAARDGRPIKAMGSGHSFTSIALTDGIAVNLDAFDRLDIDRDRQQVTVGAGVTLARLNAELATAGLALPILGDIDAQWAVGAVATATHGTGIGHRAIAAGVQAIEFVDGTGTPMRCSPDEHPDLFHVARVGLGALGIVTALTLDVVPAFNLHARDTHEQLDDVLGDFGGFVDSATHAEFYWMPGADFVNARRNDPTERTAKPPSTPMRLLDKYVLQNGGLWTFCTLGRFAPALAPRLTRTMARLTSEVDAVDRSDRVFTSPRLVRFVEMEYGFPIEVMPELVPRVMEAIDTAPEPVLFPIEVRVSAADDIPLSTGTGRTNGWVAVHQFKGAPYRDFFDRVEAIFNEYDGARPHWGKLHTLGADDLATRYPEWATFRQARDRIDPGRVFRNEYLGRVLG